MITRHIRAALLATLLLPAAALAQPEDIQATPGNDVTADMPSNTETSTADTTNANTQASAPGTDSPDYSTWYQVEVIIFAQRNAPASDEVWSQADLAYPAHMLAIAPVSDDELQPNNLAELGQLISTPQASMEASSPQPGPTGDFLFEDKSLHRQDLSVEDTDKTENADAASAQAEAARILSENLPQAFRAVEDSDYDLDGIAGSIRRSSLYRLLLHVAWRQPVVADADADPVLIQTGKRYGDDYEIDGTLTVSRSRFLHVDTNLWFNQFAQKYDQEMPLPAIVANMDPGVLKRHPALVDAEKQRDNYIKVESYPMRQSRRMRSATLHYLDNPYFGVLIEINPFDYTPEAAPQ